MRLEVSGFGSIAHTLQHVLMCQRHALGSARGAGRMQQDGNIIRPAALHEIANQLLLGCKAAPAVGEQRIERDQAFDLVGGKPARVVVYDALRAPQSLTQLEQLVDLLLILGDGYRRCTVSRVVDELLRRHVGEYWSWKGPQGRCGDRGHVQSIAIVADGGHGLSGDQAELIKGRRRGQHVLVEPLPGDFLPDAEVALAHGHLAAVVHGVACQCGHQRRGLTVLKARPFADFPKLSHGQVHAAAPASA